MRDNNLSMMEYFCAKSVENKAIDLISKQCDIFDITDDLIRDSLLGNLSFCSIFDLI